MTQHKNASNHHTNLPLEMYISRGRLVWWLLAFLHSVRIFVDLENGLMFRIWAFALFCSGRGSEKINGQCLDSGQSMKVVK